MDIDASQPKRELRRCGPMHAGLRALGAPMSEFRGFWLDVKDPPWMSMLVLAFDC